jgi:hypothetical protein
MVSRSWAWAPFHTTPTIHPSKAATSRSSGVSGGLKKLSREPLWSAPCNHAATAKVACSSPPFEYRRSLLTTAY